MMPRNGVQWGIGNMSPGVGVRRHNRRLSRGEWNNIEACPRGHLQVCPGGGGYVCNYCII